MENVKGILSSKIEGARIIDRILSDLRSPLRAQPELREAGAADLEYELFSIASHSGVASLFGSNDFDPSEYIVRCESYGIPQARHRLILLGLRKGTYRVMEDFVQAGSLLIYGMLSKTFRGLGAVFQG